MRGVWFCRRRAAASAVLVFGLGATPHGSAVAQTAAEIIDAAAATAALEAQDAGDFGAMERPADIPLGQIQRAWDQADESAGVYTVAYRADQVIRLRVRQYMTTTIVLPPWEEIGDVVVGDDFVFSARKLRANVLIVRAQYMGADASLTVVGERSGWVYPFYLRAEGPKSANIPDVTVYVRAPANLAEAVAESAPEESADVSAAAPAIRTAPETSAVDAATELDNPDFLESIRFDPAKVSFAFTMSGDNSIAPERVFEDGIFTYFDYGDRWNESDLPAVYRVVDGVDTPQNVRYRGSMIIVETTGDFTLRNGDRVVCVRRGAHAMVAARTAEAPGGGFMDDRHP